MMKRNYEAYWEINSFFDAFELPFAANRLTDCINAADSCKVWKGEKRNCPSDMILFMEKLEELLEASLQIAEDKKPDRDAILPDKKCEYLFHDYQIYRSQHADINPDHFLPRHLNSAEFINPYLV